MTTENGSENNSGNPADDNGGSATTFDFNAAVGGVEDVELRGWMENKGFDGVDKMAQSYRNLEQMFGADKAGRTVVRPKDDATPEEVGEYYNALGRPTTAGDYGMTSPEGADPAFLDHFKGVFHEAGLTESQAQTVVEKWNEFNTSSAETGMAAYNSQIQQDEDALKKEWGGAYEKNVGIAKQATREFGMDETQVDALETALGFGGLMKFMNNIGSKLGEDGFESGGNRGTGFDGITPGQAMSQLSELKADNAFRGRLLKGDKDAQAKWDRLHITAYGGK